MKVYRFRVLLQHEGEDVFRDIDIKPTDTLLELHDIIQEAFEFDNSQMASFYLSNDEWEKGEELTLFDMNDGEGSKNIRMMKEAIIGEILAGEGDRLLYHFDFMNIWEFQVELVQVVEASNKVKYPAIVEIYGKGPDQYAKSADMQDQEALILAALAESDQDSDDMPFQDDIFEGFEDFDQN